ncbi:RDD family protein [Akkermansiaceae bacterium]|nr:RDD family protein [Akkermansiaceae bacterium]
MEIWLIINGKRSGPYPDYEIRGRIEHGEMGRDEMVWHEGLAEWTPVGELELFSKSFGGGRAKALPPPLPTGHLDKSGQPNPHLGRRFWARWLDLMGFSALWWLGMYLSGRDIEVAMANMWLLLSMYMPWFAIESWLLHSLGWTPGKWLMGLRVVNEDGSALALKPAVWRSLRVMVTGVGFGWGLLAVLCNAMSWFTTRRLGKPIWDHIGGHKVVARDIGAFPILAMIFAFQFFLVIHFCVLGRYAMKHQMDEMTPEQRKIAEQWEKIYFPERR